MRALKRWRKIVAALAAVFAASLLSTMVSFAEETISSVRLAVTSEIMAGDDSGGVTVTAADADCHYSIEDYEITNEKDYWKVGDEPIVKITLTADTGYQFKNVKKSSITLTGYRSTVSSGPNTKENGHILELKIRLSKLDGTLELDNVEWEGELSPIARWDDDAGAQKYQVRLYRGESAVGDIVTVSQRSCNFAASITREGEYSFRVRAVGNNKKGEWYDSDSIYVTEEDLPEIKKKVQSTSTSSSGSSGSSKTTTVGINGIVTPAGTRGSTGSWQHDKKGWWFRYPDGTYPKGGWLQIGAAWYCFDDVGYMRTGWIKAKNGDYYYCDERAGSGQGALLRDQRTPDGYWVNEKGIWVPGA